MTEEQKLSIITLKNKGLKYQEISNETGLTVSSIASYISRNHRDLLKKNPLTEEETLLVIELRDQGISYSIIAEQLGKTVDHIKKKCSALLKEGKIQNIRGARGGNMSISSPTTLYLVKFNDFYKVGVTQQKLKDRFSGAPEYSIIDTMSTSLEEAWELEKAIKSVVESFIPGDTWFIRNGRTECFKTEKQLTALEDLL
jgi:transcriptional regulator